MGTKRSNGVSYAGVFILMVIAFAVGAGVGVGGFIYVTGGSGEPSRDVNEVIADLETDSDAQTAPTVAPTAEEATQSTDNSATSAGATTYTIVSEQSTATFTLEEDLNGVRTTVIGTTSEVGGTIQVNMANPSASTVGPIAVNARTLATDSDMRNRTIRSRILNSAEDAYEFITFVPQSLSNFSADSVSVGDTITFDITGDLTIKGVTQSVTFNASVTVDSESQISGTATTNVLYADFGLVIPSVPQVANVTEDVDLAITFIATAGA